MELFQSQGLKLIFTACYVKYIFRNCSVETDENFVNLNYAFEDYFIFTNQAGKLGVLKVWEGTVVEPKYDQIFTFDGYCD